MAFLFAIASGFLVLGLHHLALLGTSFFFMLLALALNVSHGVVIGYVMGFFSSRGDIERSFAWLITWGFVMGIVTVLLELPLRALWDMDVLGAFLFSSVFGGVGGILYVLLERATPRNRDPLREKNYADAIANHSTMDEQKTSKKT